MAPSRGQRRLPVAAGHDAALVLGDADAATAQEARDVLDATPVRAERDEDAPLVHPRDQHPRDPAQNDQGTSRVRVTMVRRCVFQVKGHCHVPQRMNPQCESVHHPKSGMWAKTIRTQVDTITCCV